MVKFKKNHFYKRTYNDTSYIVFIVEHVDDSDFVIVKVLKNSDGDSLATMVHKDYNDAVTIELDELTTTTMVL